MYRQWIKPAAILCVIFGTGSHLSIDAHGSDLGMTPSHVYELWVNINKAVLTYGDARGLDSRQARSLSASEFQGMKPSDVLKLVVKFRARVDILRARLDLEKTTVHQAPGDGVVTPSDVFLNSGHVLDSTMLLINRTNAHIKLAPFFRRQSFVGKVPSDVYGQVELAIRRLDTLIN